MNPAHPPLVQQELQCYHCGTHCPDDTIHLEDKFFCCEGCKTVYEVLEANNLCQYYSITTTPGQMPQPTRFEFLDNPEVIAQLIDFKNNTITKITFFVPSIHCSSCLWLLENLNRIHPAIQSSRVDFLKKQVTVVFRSEIHETEAIPTISLRQLAELMTSVGYEPLISLNDVVKEKQRPSYRPLLTRIAVAGFCAGNIMLFSFPEYLGLDEVKYKHLFGYLNIILAIPAVFYAGSEYFVSVWSSIKAKRINLDLPILLAILTAFFRGIYEVLFQDGAGYFDSVTGLIFLLLVGKWFQQRTYDFLSFERDYKSYFPLAVTRLKRVVDPITNLSKDVEESATVASLQKGDKILIRNEELIPADGMLYKGTAHVDYSFVTGESDLQTQRPGDLLYAGGKHVGHSIEMEVLKEVAQSYLTQLWNNNTFAKKQANYLKTFANQVGKNFTIVVLMLAAVVSVYWYWMDPSKVLNALTAVLIVACPCALALSYPFALGHALRVFGAKHFYLKNAEVIEQMAQCDTIVFDKTGTLTTAGDITPTFEGQQPLNEYQALQVASLVRHSTHPLSRKISHALSEPIVLPVSDFQEVTGKGLEGVVEGHSVKIGSLAFVRPSVAGHYPTDESQSSRVHVQIDDEYLGYFALPNHYRKGLDGMIYALEQHFSLFVLSGDSAAERRNLSRWFLPEQLHFNCQPQQKLDFIKQLQAKGKRVMMIGDGLNDAGALKQADVGVAITEKTVCFTPASDAILEAGQLTQLPAFLKFCRLALQVIKISFVVSLIYNAIGLSFAVTGTLSPLVAAILMPVSSTTMVLLATFGIALSKRVTLTKKADEPAFSEQKEEVYQKSAPQMT
ncbi:MAG: heavy metal translocating P-type ATPase metal-binding domain-containing protein [Spirosomataceae bacterium]